MGVKINFFLESVVLANVVKLHLMQRRVFIQNLNISRLNFYQGCFNEIY